MIEIINSKFELLGVISNYESLIFNRAWHGVGDFELHINKEKKNVDKLQKDNFIIINKSKNKVGIIEDVKLDCNNTKTLIVTGKQLKGIKRSSGEQGKGRLERLDEQMFVRPFPCSGGRVP